MQLPSVLRNPAVRSILLAVSLLFLVGMCFIALSEESSPEPDTMTATVEIMPGTIQVINEDTFPWYGLIITVNNRYSTKYRMGDYNWSFISSDSITYPYEQDGADIEAFIDASGNEYEGKLYTIIVADVKIEAKSQVDGPYDLEATFEFSIDDPILRNGIMRSNKPSEPGLPPVESYPLYERPERPPDIRAYVNDGKATSIWLSPGEPEYNEIREFLSGQPQDDFGAYRISPETYNEMQALFTSLQPDTKEQAGELWRTQWKHYDRIDAFQESMAEIDRDRIIDEEEAQHICFALDQWTAQMVAAKEYVQEYREVDPEMVEKVTGLRNLEAEAERALDLLATVECK